MSQVTLHPQLRVPATVLRYALDDDTLNLRVALAGHYLLARRTSSPAVEISVKLNTPDSRTIPLKEGEGFRHLAFDRLYFTWDAQPGEWIELVYAGDPTEADPRMVEIFRATASQNVSIADVNTTSILPVRDARDPAPQNAADLSSASDWVWKISTAAVSTSACTTIPAGKVLVLHGCRIWNQNNWNLDAELQVVDASSNIVARVKSSTQPKDVFIGWRLAGGVNGLLLECNSVGLGDVYVDAWGILEDA